jgi:purine-binding chemotaxis protein CheW
MASQKLVIFKVNEEDFGVDINQVNSIIEPLEIYKVPNTPDFIEGLINLRGKVYTVFDLRKRFHFPTRTTDENTKIIIVSVNSMMVGFIVDAVNEIVTFEENDIESTPQALAVLDRKYITGIAKKGNKIVLMLNLANVLSLGEQQQINKA